MKSIECYIIQDLLPLYIDHACSEQQVLDYVALDTFHFSPSSNLEVIMAFAR